MEWSETTPRSLTGINICILVLLMEIFLALEGLKAVGLISVVFVIECERVNAWSLALSVYSLRFHQ